MNGEFGKRVAAADWTAVTREVDDYGCALLPPLLAAGEGAEITALYDEPERFRATIDMRRYRFRQRKSCRAKRVR